MNNKKILIVEDEDKIRKIVAAYLEKEGFIIKEAINGKEALKYNDDFQPDLMILDLMLPKISGEEVCQRIRQNSDLPILMLTAKSSEEDKVSGFNFGADDYLTKPFSNKELVARVKAILRRSDYKAEKADVLLYSYGNLKIYPSKMKVEFENRNIDLTNTEFKIFYILAKNKNQVLTREQIAEKVMGVEFKGFDRTIDAHIKNIRKKMKLNKDEYIITVYGAGYKFIDNKEGI
ncbi:MAG: response regulator transcription factor [Bacillota bacterium]